ncbi:Fe-S cluster carrier protein ApbC [Natronomonas pharaonis DSM 2160]|uniref:Iron-sulfur cluster carrier protein n=1 Tax=Natronomonas pharaonis (strain ATCC 35678 / DSM 2160 / CIP 103997 / JCM 8858 / NBRC 14720 / NCIMB 2260 / Gabara) TaxID=348780 RepID=A0A1U7EZ34_NATPD|nr:Mrp/NBP35 family ATP-binding protein [Natronomonas pharaonis]CAI50561.1 Fe-S cluster carrier protein ApbC [Natronomonas pharaonis DSM 2160]
MTELEDELEARLREIEDPIVGEDILSMQLINDVEIDDGTASISLAFNTPFAPAELELGDEIRAAVSDVGLEPDLYAEVGREHGFDEEVMPNVRNVVAVASGKGGVGKTTVAANLAAGLDELGARVGLLDADIHGPNAPRVLPVEEQPGVTPDEKIVPPTADGVKVMSMGFLLEEEDDPAILRGPMVNNVMTHFFENVEWGALDYLVVDLPPGTGDASLDLVQTLPVAGVVIVTTPQEMAVDDARKGLRLFEKHETPVLGIVENMSRYHCPSCGDEHDPFGRGGAEEMVESYDVELLGQLPIHEDFGADGSELPAVKLDASPVQDAAQSVMTDIADRLGEVNRLKVADMLELGREEDKSPVDESPQSQSGPKL